MSWTATAPSPTAAATRFDEPWRTSPAAKIPGTLVSSERGQAARRPPGRALAVAHEIEARHDEAARIARQHAVAELGARPGADEHEHRRGGDLPGAPSPVRATSASSRSVPLTSSTSVSGTTSMLGVAAI